MKVLITGGRGQVAQALAAHAPENLQVVAPARGDLDITDPVAVAAVCEKLSPDIIINAAAFTNVDGAESDATTAQAVNADGARTLAAAAAACGARLLHISTDYVFPGDSCVPYAPDNPAEPLGEYGKSKLSGERAVRKLLPARSVVLRTAWVYSAHGRNFLLTMMRLMREKRRVRVVADQFGTPTSARSLAEALWAFAARPELSGLHHWTDAGTATWYDFAVAIAEEGANLGMLPAGVEVEPIATQDYPTPARRPRFSVLDCRATVAALGTAQVHWRVNLRKVLAELPNA
jgi:dTDP-4-dehydrorhamnose reductase